MMVDENTDVSGVFTIYCRDDYKAYVYTKEPVDLEEYI